MSGAEHDSLMEDLAAYALGTLAPAERDRVAAHLATCPECRSELAALSPVAARLVEAGPPLPELPPELRARTLAAVGDAAATAPVIVEPSPAVAPRPPLRRPRLGHRHGLRFAFAAAAVAALLAALFVGRSLDDPIPQGDPGPLELVATLEAPDGRSASLDVFFTGIGRVIEFDTDDLPILPKGEYYELWFVGPGDRRGAPNRISAGTFHPDENGRSQVTFAAAVEPALYPEIAISAEPGDGDPAPTRPDVLRGRGRPGPDPTAGAG